MSRSCNESGDRQQSGFKILAVDDDAVSLFILKKILVYYGHSVTCVSSGFACFEKLSCTKYDIVLMDIAMPEINGIDTLTRIREYGHTIPVIATTAHALKTEQEHILKSGFDGYISKPYDYYMMNVLIRETIQGV